MSGPSEFELPEEHVELYYKLRELTKLADEYTKALDDVRRQLKHLAYGHDYVTIGGQRVLLITRTHPKRFDVKAFQIDQPRLFESYLRPSQTEVVTMRFAVDRP